MFGLECGVCVWWFGGQVSYILGILYIPIIKTTTKHKTTPQNVLHLPSHKQYGSAI